MRKNIRGEIDPETLGAIAILALLGSAAVALWGVVWAGTPLGFTGYIGNLLLVVHANLGFWIVFVIATGFGIYRKLSNPDDFMWLELPVQLAASTLTVISLTCLFFSTSTNLTDTEIWNGYVQGAEYREAWTELVTTTTTDSKGRTTTHTSTVHHPPEWKECTTAGDFSIDKSLYRTLVQYFSNEKKKILIHSGQISIGDGNMYYVSYEPGKKQIIPASRPHWFVNYLKASDSIQKIQGSMSLYKEFLRPYPSVYSGTYGEIEINRVIEAGVNLPQKWKDDVDRTLDFALTQLGAKKEVNILVYAVNTKDEGFTHALEESWVKCKQNDVIVILGVPEFPKVSFVYVTAWTKIEEFRINLRNKILDEDISDGVIFANSIIEEVSRPPEQGGFKRMPMSDLEYLIADIRLPWWCQILIVLVGGFVSWITSIILINNQYRR